jgi:hypothetical protein
MAAAAPSNHVSAVAKGGSAADGRAACTAGCNAGARAVQTGLTALGGSRTAAQSGSEKSSGPRAVGMEISRAEFCFIIYICRPPRNTTPYRPQEYS